MDSWKTLIIFFFQKTRKSKNAVYYQKNQTRKLFGDFSWGAFQGIFEFACPS